MGDEDIADEAEGDDDVVVLDLSKEEPDEKPEKEEKPAKPDYDEYIEKARGVAREEIEKRAPREPTPLPAGQRFSEPDLSKAEDELDEKIESGEIGAKEARRLQRIIDGHRTTNRDEEQVARRDLESRMGSAERSVTMWAKDNAPAYLEEDSKESKEAETFLMETLGAHKHGDYYVLSKKVGRIAAGILNQANSRTQKDTGPARKKELASKQPARTGPPGKSKLAEVTRAERDILSSVGLRKERVGLYHQFKKAGMRKPVEVDG